MGADCELLSGMVSSACSGRRAAHCLRGTPTYCAVVRPAAFVRAGSIDVGIGSAGGVVAIILANIVAIFLMRMIGKNLDI